MTPSCPAGWTSINLGALGLCRSDSVEASESPNQSFELWSVPCFPTGEPEVVRGQEVRSNKQRVREGDVLLCKINPRINRVWRIRRSRGLPQIASTEWIVFRGPAFDPDFLMWRFREPGFREVLLRTVAGVGGSLTRARPKAVEQITLNLPPLAEQRRITARLERLETRIRRARASLDAIPAQLVQARQSLLAAAFRVRTDGGLRTGWVWSRLSDCSTITGGLTKNPGRRNIRQTRPYLRVANVYANRLELDDVTRIGVAIDELEKLTLKKNDLLVVEGNGSPDQIGRVALWDGSIPECVHQNHLIKVRMAPEVFPRYALWWLLSPVGRLHIGKIAKSSSGLYTLSVGKVAALPIPLTSLPEQREIVRRLEKSLARLDATAAAHAAAVVDLDRLEQSLLARAFRGELVAQDPRDEPAEKLLERLAKEREANGEEDAKPRRRRRS